MAQSFPAWLAAMAAYITNPKGYMYGMWDSPTPGAVNGPYGPGVPGEGGVDLGAPSGTPVYALATGVVEGSGYWKDSLHGVVTTRVNVPGVGMEDLYYQHINIAPGITTGMTVQQGQQIGTVGSLNETEVGFNANWGQPWGTNHPGPWISDPRPWIQALMQSPSGAAGPGTGTQAKTNNTDCCNGNFGCEVCANFVAGFGGSSAGLCCGGAVGAVAGAAGNNLFSGLGTWMTQAGIVIFGAVIVIVALILVFK